MCPPERTHLVCSQRATGKVMPAGKGLGIVGVVVEEAYLGDGT